MVCGPRVAIRAHGRVVRAKHGSTAFDGEVAIRAHGRVVSTKSQRAGVRLLQSACTGEW